MGFHIEVVTPPDEFPPIIMFNHCGAADWGGKHISELGAMDMVHILELCRSMGWEEGWKESYQGRAGDFEKGPFDEGLLGGFPALEWKRSYLQGVEDQTNQRRTPPWHVDSEDE